MTAKIKQCICSGVCHSQHFSLSLLKNHYFVSIILLLLGYDLLKIIPLNVNWAPVNNFTHFCEQIISYQSLQVRIQKCQPIGGFNWGLEARRPLTYQINRCRRARKNWGSFLIKKTYKKISALANFRFSRLFHRHKQHQSVWIARNQELSRERDEYVDI